MDRSETAIDEIRRTPGAWLYHYTTLQTALVYVLSTLTLRLSPFSDMRDPREYKRWVTTAVGYGENMDDFTRRWLEADDRVNALRQQFKLLSLTSEADDPEDGDYDRGFARSRLWEAYAGRGTGVCLVLNRAVAIDSIASQLRELGECDHGLVTYKSEPFRQAVTLIIDEGGDVDSVADRIAEQYMHNLFRTKNREWESEREYRFIVRTDKRYEYVGIEDSLVAMILGPEAASGATWETQWIARLAANELRIGLGLLQWDNNKPMLLGLPVAESADSLQRRRMGRRGMPPAN